MKHLPPDSPCVDVCRIDAASGWCEGCLRTLEEIAAWSALDDAGKRAVHERIARRRAQWPLPSGATRSAAEGA